MYSLGVLLIEWVRYCSFQNEHVLTVHELFSTSVENLIAEHFETDYDMLYDEKGNGERFIRDRLVLLLQQYDIKWH